MSNTESSYTMPLPGTVLYFSEVRDAIEAYSDSDVLFFLAIDLFTADGPLDETDDRFASEVERLRSLGYQVGYSDAWTYHGEGEDIPYTFLCGLFTLDEPINFHASLCYGYAFRFPHNGDGSAVQFNQN